MQRFVLLVRRFLVAIGICLVPAVCLIFVVEKWSRIVHLAHDPGNDVELPWHAVVQLQLANLYTGYWWLLLLPLALWATIAFSHTQGPTIRRIASVVQGLLAFGFMGGLALVNFWMPSGQRGTGWQRVFYDGDLRVDMYWFALGNVIALPVLALMLWRLRQMTGPRPDDAGVRWANRFVVSIFIACLFVTALHEGLLRGAPPLDQQANAPPPPGDATLEYPILPLVAQQEFSWELQDLRGNTLDVAHLRGKAVFLNVWATWCGPCKRELPSVQRLAESFRDNPNVVFVLVTNEDPEKVRGWVKGEGSSYDLTFYTVGEFHQRFMPSAFPTTFFIAPNGETVFSHVGAVTWDGEKTKTFLAALAMPDEPISPKVKTQ